MRTGWRGARGRGGRAAWFLCTPCGTARVGAGSARPPRRTPRCPPGSHGGITLKPSAAPDSAHSWIVSATWSGVPVTTRWPRAPASRWHSWRSVGFSRSTMSSTSWNRLPSLRSSSVSMTSRGNGSSRSYADRSTPVSRLSWASEYPGWVRSLNSWCRSSASFAVDPMNGLMPGSTLSPSRVAALCLRAALDVGVELLRRPERLVRGEDRLGLAGGEGPPVLRRPGLHVDRPALRGPRRVERPPHPEVLADVVDRGGSCRDRRRSRSPGRRRPRRPPSCPTAS